MKIKKEQIDQIRKQFAKMQSKEDLVNLLSEAKNILYGEDCKPVQLKSITYYANPSLCKKRYNSFIIKKKSGENRMIHTPVKGLKTLQIAVSFILQCVYEPHKAAMGFVRNRSIVDNAKLHTGSYYVYNIDLKDFFHSIDQARVWKCLQLEPFKLVNKEKVVKSNLLEKPSYKISLLTPFDSNSREITLKFSYKGYNFKPGLKVLKLKSGDKIIYKVFTKGNSSGVAELYLERSSYELMRKTVRDFSENDDERLGYLLASFMIIINAHQKKLSEKDNRGVLANIIAALCCNEMEVERKNEAGEWEKVKRNVLPQGAPTSPVITNIVCQKLDFLLTGVAKRFGLRYSRYADDITFSSQYNVFQPESEFLKEVHRIISEQNFHIKESKTRIQKAGYRQEVTGLVVNDKVNVRRRYVKQIRMWLYLWEKWGYEIAQQKFLKDYFADKGHVKNINAHLVNVLDGKLEFLKMVKGHEDGTYKGLKERFEELNGITNPINKVLEVWEEDGIENAIDFYYKYKLE